MSRVFQVVAILALLPAALVTAFVLVAGFVGLVARGGLLGLFFGGGQ